MQEPSNEAWLQHAACAALGQRHRRGCKRDESQTRQVVEHLVITLSSSMVNPLCVKGGGSCFYSLAACKSRCGSTRLLLLIIPRPSIYKHLFHLTSLTGLHCSVRNAAAEALHIIGTLESMTALGQHVNDPASEVGPRAPTLHHFPGSGLEFFMRSGTVRTCLPPWAA